MTQIMEKDSSWDNDELDPVLGNHSSMYMRNLERRINKLSYIIFGKPGRIKWDVPVNMKKAKRLKKLENRYWHKIMSRLQGK